MDLSSVSSNWRRPGKTLSIDDHLLSPFVIRWQGFSGGKRGVAMESGRRYPPASPPGHDVSAAASPGAELEALGPRPAPGLWPTHPTPNVRGRTSARQRPR